MPKGKQKTNNQSAYREKLKNPEFAAQYLMDCLERNSTNREEVFLNALRDVAKAHSFQTVAEKANLGRESLYKAISQNGNPKFMTLTSILKAMGLQFLIRPDNGKLKKI